jgi:hypothetical protein
VSVLVFFVADPVDDDVAAAVRRRVAPLRRLGFLDDPGATAAQSRTTGGFVRDPQAADAEALWGAALGASRELGITVELQWREAVLGHVRAGRPDAGLREAVLAVGAG